MRELPYLGAFGQGRGSSNQPGVPLNCLLREICDVATSYSCSLTQAWPTSSGSRFPEACTALSVAVVTNKIHPTMKKKINDRIACRYDPVLATTMLNSNGPIHDVPRSETS